MQIPDAFYRVSAKALVFDEEGKVLLLKEPGKGWELPGGGIEHGKHPHETIERELMEEAGFVADSIADTPLLIWTQEIETKRLGQVWVMLLGYRVTLKEMNFVPSDEAEDYGFFSSDEMESDIELIANIAKLPQLLRAIK